MRRTTRGVEVDFAELSDAGLDPSKSINEDSCVFVESPHGHLALVCDGMGGHVSGREASQLATRTIVEEVSAAHVGLTGEQILENAIRTAGRAVYALGGNSALEARPGSTCVAVLIDEQGAIVAHVGDSRVLLVREQTIVRLTRDHSMVQQLVDAGLLTPEQALHHPEANKITRALGIRPEVEVELRSSRLALQRDDVLLLASDGLTDLVTEVEIRDRVQQRLALGPVVLCQDFVALARQRGGHDNITVQILHILDAPPRSAQEVRPPPTQGDDLAPPFVPEGPPRVAPTIVASSPMPGAVNSGAVSPTLWDDGAWPPRTTQPDLGPLPIVSFPAPGGPSPGNPSPGNPSSASPSPRGPSLTTLPPQKLGLTPIAVLALLVLVLIIGGLAVFGVKLLRQLQATDRPPPPLHGQVLPPASTRGGDAGIALEPDASAIHGQDAGRDASAFH